jgi:hexosaminidase
LRDPEPPAGQLRLASRATIDFTSGLLTAVAKLFPSKLISTGGDEINANCYADDAETQAELSESFSPSGKVVRLMHLL